VIGFGHWPAALRAAAFAWSAVRYARRDQPELIISTHVNFAPVARLMKRFASISFAAVGHGIEVWNIDKASVRDGLRCADQLIAVSEFTKTRMAAAVGVNASRIEVLPNTFDADRFQPGPKPAALLKRYGLASEQPVILTVARLAETEQYKGYDNVLRALPAVLQTFPEARYVIVGDGPDRRRVERLSKGLGVEQKVTLAGYVPNEELSDHYNLCDVFVMPSTGEGFGIVFLEALGCGKPVIAGNRDASAEAVLNGKLGTMVDPEDVAAIAGSILAVLAARRSERTAGSGQRTEDRGRKAEVRGQTADNRITDKGEPQSAGELLRREVIAAYGFERFRERLGEILGKVGSGSRR
jgi:glycosyltransferase involved in cell wall biosynthesis